MLHFPERHVKNHKQLVSIDSNDTTSTDILENNVLDNFYPQCPRNMDDVCLHDFINGTSTVEQTPVDRERTASRPRHGCPIINCTIPAMSSRERITFTLLYSFTSLSEMKVI